MTTEEEEIPEGALCPICYTAITKVDKNPDDPQEQMYYCPKCDKWKHFVVFGSQVEEEEEKDLKEALEKWLGRAILLKYVGYGLFGSSLGLIILSSLLRIHLPFLTQGILVGILLIIIGIVAEKVLAQ